MVHPDHPTIESTLLKNLTSGSAFAIAFIFLVLQYTFKLDFQCPCNAYDNQIFCALYFFFPPVGLLVILSLTTKTCTIMCKKCCSCSMVCWRITCKDFFRNTVLSVLWIITILIDGDAYVCWMLTEKNITHWSNQTPCKEKNKLTAEESKKVKYYQSESQVWGLIFLFVIPIVYLLVSMFCQLFWLYKENYYKVLYEDAYEEDKITCAEMGLREKAKEKAKEKCMSIIDGNMEGDVINNNMSPQMIALTNAGTSSTSQEPSPGTSKTLVTPGTSSTSQEPSPGTSKTLVTPGTSSTSQEPSPGTSKTLVTPGTSSTSQEPSPGTSETLVTPGTSSTSQEPSPGTSETLVTPGTSSTSQEPSPGTSETLVTPGTSETSQEPSPGTSETLVTPGTSSTSLEPSPGTSETLVTPGTSSTSQEPSPGTSETLVTPGTSSSKP